MSSEPGYRPDIDGLRALAVIAVVAFHAFPQALPGGFIGVDVFFVISGYLITRLLLAGLAGSGLTLADFYLRRARRIFPALLLVLLVTGALGFVLLIGPERRELFKHMAGGAGFVANFVLWQEAGYFDAAAETKPLLHLWSLAIEEQFYLLWPLLLALAWRLRRIAPVAPLWVVLGVAALSLGLNLACIGHDGVATFYAPQTRFWALWCGAALAMIGGRGGPASAARHALSLASLALLAAAAWGLSGQLAYPGAWALLPVAAALGLIHAGPGSWVNRCVLAHPALVWIGLLSYPLYLWHWPLLSLARIVVGDTPSAEVRAAAVLLALLLAFWTYRLVETPLRHGAHGSRKAAALCVALACLGVGSALAYRATPVSAEDLTLAANAAQLGWQAPVASPAQVAACRSRFPERQALTPAQRDDNFCLIARDATADVLMVGDSMGLNLFPGLSRRSGFNTLLLGASSAAPLYDIRTTEFSDTIRSHNYRLTNHALDLALRDDSVRVVVMVFLGGPSLAMKGSGYGITDIRHPDRTGAEQVFKAALAATIRPLLDRGKRVIYVLPNPALSYDIRSCIAPPRPFEADTERVCDQSADIHLAAGGHAYRAWVHEVLREFPQVQVFDAAAPLCDAGRCWGFKDGQLLYRDRLHLSLAGSDRVAAALAPLIDAALAGR